MRAAALQQMAHGDPAAEILSELCLRLERELPGMIVGVALLDRTLQIFEHGLFPSLDDAYASGLKGIFVADKPGSCALAVFEGKTVVCDDVAADPRFSEAWKQLSLAHGLRALVSIPAVQRDGLTLGTLVVAYAPDAPPSAEQRALADEVALLCGSVLSYRRSQMRHELLIGELQHRLRNLFSTMGAVVYATMRSHPEPEAFRRIFDGRLTALAKAHSLALEAQEAELRDILVGTLAPYSIDHTIDIDGPPLILTHEAAVAFSLATHELATNAAKYGALSKDDGTIRIRYGFEGDDNQRFVLTWEESGGPQVEQPTRQGFGQKTLARSIASAFDGTVDLDYHPSGLRCRVVAPQSPRLGARAN